MNKQHALLGALLGDAVGVPYEFKNPLELPPRKHIDMVPPIGFKKTYDVPFGTWSDDGALLLCLLEALQENSTEPDVWARSFAIKARNWRMQGYFAVDGKLFDIGGQTAAALSEVMSGPPYDPLKRDRDYSDGNGSLMRDLAPALVADSLEQAIQIADLQSIVTHNTEDCRSTCRVYAALTYMVLHGQHLEDALPLALAYGNDRLRNWSEARGRGWVIDSFWSAIYALRQGKNFKEVIQHSIALGDDTDTTACIAGGIAGMLYPLPDDWVAGLRGKYLLVHILGKL